MKIPNLYISHREEQTLPGLISNSVRDEEKKVEFIMNEHGGIANAQIRLNKLINWAASMMADEEIKNPFIIVRAYFIGTGPNFIELDLTDRLQSEYKSVIEAKKEEEIRDRVQRRMEECPYCTRPISEDEDDSLEREKSN